MFVLHNFLNQFDQENKLKIDLLIIMELTRVLDYYYYYHYYLNDDLKMKKYYDFVMLGMDYENYDDDDDGDDDIVDNYKNWVVIVAWN